MQKSNDESKKPVSFAEVRVSDEMVGTQGSVPMPERSTLESPTKSNFKVFMFGYGTGKFTSKMELSDMKRRQLRQQTTEAVSDGGEDEGDRRRSGKKRWWRLIDAFRCGGGYEEDVATKDLQASFHTLKRFD